MVLTCNGAQALDPTRTIRQFHHTAWTIADGLPGAVWALAQSRDGYLWLGTGLGLYRFDGVHFEPFRPLSGELLSGDVTALAALPSDEIWIGYQNGGVSVLRNGRVVNFTASDGAPPLTIFGFAQGEDGAVWAASAGGLARFKDGRWRRVDAAWGFPARSVWGVSEAGDGALWAATDVGVFVLRHGSGRFQRVSGPMHGRPSFARDSDGRLWISNGGRRARVLSDLTPSPDVGRAPPWSSAPSGALHWGRAVFDHEGSLWGVDRETGLYRVRRPLDVGGKRRAPRDDTAERFTLKDGLTSDLATALLEDREGNIWVGTNLGLDRFRAADVVIEKGIPPTSVQGYRAVADAGTLYVSGAGSLFRVRRGGKPDIVVRDLGAPRFLYRARNGVIWVCGRAGLMKLADRVLTRSPAPVGSHEVMGAAEDGAGALWILVDGRGILRLVNGAWTPFAVSGRSGAAPQLIQGDRNGGIWISFADGGLVWVDNQTVRSFSPGEGPGIGQIEVIYQAARGLLFGGERGLSRFDGRRFHTLTTAQAPALIRTTGIVETPQGQTWLNSQTGVLRIAAKDLDAAFEHPEHPVRYELLDFRDGLPGVAEQESFENTAVKGPNGRLWFVTGHGVVWVDPNHLNENSHPPPVSIRSVTANGKEYPSATTLQLPAGVTNLRFDFAALSLSIPERVRFRYRLEGVDDGWVDPGDRRQAFYTKLAPGRYRFQVIAANNDQVWNRTGASLVLVIPPTFVQSAWFLALCLLAGAGVLWLLYSLRLRRVSERIRIGLEERLAERERIARELHDTLLQGFQGLILRFQAVADRMPDDQPARALMERALDRADEVLVEGRDRVRKLRIEEGCGELSQIFAAAAERLALDHTVKVRVIVEGAPRALHPIARDEISMIGNEAIFNAFQHANARNIEIGIVYHRSELRVRFRDDGVGVAADVLEGGRPGHFGLAGMRERAQGLRAEFAARSRLGAGTEIELTIPAAVAYAAKPRKWRLRPRRAAVSED